MNDIINERHLSFSFGECYFGFEDKNNDNPSFIAFGSSLFYESVNDYGFVGYEISRVRC